LKDRRSNPLDALIAARLKAPDLLISDVAMPGVSGIELAIQMRAQYPACKVLLFSGQAATMDLLEDARAQGHDFDLLQKPIPPTELLSEVGKMVNTTSQTTAARPVRRRGSLLPRVGRSASRLHKGPAIGMVQQGGSPSESKRES
jgi:DNA-binding NtrC family response regulator